MRTLLYDRASLVWFVLAMLTVVSWSLGTDHGLGGKSPVPASLAIVVLAVVKVRLVGLYFMELRRAPVPLRAALEIYCATMLTVLVSLYLFA